MKFKEFSRKLLKWDGKSNHRALPWKGERDPYRIWLREIILQQTRAEQGLAYYERFITKFPTVQSLALAKDDEVFKLWEGLGYYSRCRNLLITARFIAFEQKGVFPESYEALLQLKGVGAYTAAAIAAFAFGASKAVVDGNVFRVLSRYFGLEDPIDTGPGKKKFQEYAALSLGKADPAAYNQAIMDFGAIVCKPLKPLCNDCPFQASCVAFKHNLTGVLPVKAKTIQRKTRFFYYFILSYKDGFYIRQRKEKDIWKGLYEWHLWESPKEIANQEAEYAKGLATLIGPAKATLETISDLRVQQLTHQTIRGRFIMVSLKQKLPADANYLLVPGSRLKDYAFPQFINACLQNFTRRVPPAG